MLKMRAMTETDFPKKGTNHCPHCERPFVTFHGVQTDLIVCGLICRHCGFGSIVVFPLADLAARVTDAVERVFGAPQTTPPQREVKP